MIAREDDAVGVMEAVEQLKAGDSAGLALLYLRYRDEVRRCVGTIVRDDQEAEDVTQSVFLKVLLVVDGYEPCGVPFGAWLLRVARNAAIDVVRARRAVPTEQVRAIDEGRQQLALERREALKEALSGLPRDQREVIVLRYVAGLSALEIADRLQKSAGSVYGLQHRGRRSMKAALTELEVMPVAA